MQQDKSMLNSILTLALIFCSGFIAWGQNIPQTSVRLSNPEFDVGSRMYTLDVELQSDMEDQQLFGMNVRFFYDASKMTFLDFRNIASGYGILGKAPKAFVGNSSSGYYMFNLEDSVAFVNGAVQLMQEFTNLKISENGWTKYFQISFEVPASVVESELPFYPSVILDSKGSESGGFFKGEDGVVITLVEDDPETLVVSKPSITATVDHFNWEYRNHQDYPFGNPVAEEGIDFAGDRLNNNLNTPAATGFKVYQNFPNPFDDRTSIGFELPQEGSAKLRFFDVTGREVKVIEGQFMAGSNTVTIFRNMIPEATEVLLYLLETPNFSSGMMKMSVVTK